MWCFSRSCLIRETDVIYSCLSLDSADARRQELGHHPRHHGRFPDPCWCRGRGAARHHRRGAGCRRVPCAARRACQAPQRGCACGAPEEEGRGSRCCQEVRCSCRYGSRTQAYLPHGHPQRDAAGSANASPLPLDLASVLLSLQGMAPGGRYSPPAVPRFPPSLSSSTSPHTSRYIHC